MTAVHLSLLLPFVDPWFLNAGTFRNELFYFIVPTIRNSIKKGIFHAFISEFFFEKAKLSSRYNALVERILYLEFAPDILKAIDEWVHIILLSTFFSFPRDRKEDLASW